MITRVSLSLSLAAFVGLAIWWEAGGGRPRATVHAAALRDLDELTGSQATEAAATTEKTLAQRAASDPWTKLLVNMPQPVALPVPLNETRIRLPGIAPGDSREQYNHDLIKLALDETVASDGPYELQETEPSTGLRSFVRVLQGTLDITWCLTTNLRESLLKPVRFDMYRGLQGYRVLIIRRGDEARFAAVHSIEDLRALRAGGAADWQSSSVLAANRLPMVTSDSYESLFLMLNHGRYDYFSRALVEPWAELTERHEAALTVEPELLVHFPAAMFMFVHPDRTRLADRLQRGLTLATNDGRFEALIRATGEFKSMWENAHVSHRRVLELNNPFISAATLATGGVSSYTSSELSKLMP